MPLSDRPVRVGISGSYGGFNLGDEAILQVILNQLRATLPVEVTVFSRDAQDTLVRHKVDRAIPVRDLSRDEVGPVLRGLDLLILGGGGILYDAEAAQYLREVALAHEQLVPDIAAGEVQEELGRQGAAVGPTSRPIRLGADRRPP